MFLIVILVIFIAVLFVIALSWWMKEMEKTVNDLEYLIYEKSNSLTDMYLRQQERLNKLQLEVGKSYAWKVRKEDISLAKDGKKLREVMKILTQERL